jgi:acetyl-CoA carboxylase carboxyltransferase component
VVAAFTEKFANPYVAAERGFVDDVIDPADTRIKLVEGLRVLRTKRDESPQRKHGNIPL